MCFLLSMFGQINNSQIVWDAQNPDNNIRFMFQFFLIFSHQHKTRKKFWFQNPDHRIPVDVDRNERWSQSKLLLTKKYSTTHELLEMKYYCKEVLLEKKYYYKAFVGKEVLNHSWNIGQRSFTYRAVHIWNNLDKNLKDCSSLKIFKEALKKHLLAKDNI
jgi:hypothetical protein